MTSTPTAETAHEQLPSVAAAASVAQPTLLREWSYPPASDPPVAPAVVLKEEESPSEEESSPNKLQQLSQSFSYPVATFVSSLVRSGVGNGYAPGEIPENVEERDANNTQHEAGEAQTITVRSEPAITIGVDTTLRTAVSEPGLGNDEVLDEAEFVLVDGDLVAVPAPPPNEEELEAFEESLERKNCRMRQFKRFGKWIKKRRPRRATPRNGEEAANPDSEVSAVAQSAQGRKKNKRNRKKRRQGRQNENEEEQVQQQVVPVAEGYAEPATAEARLIGDADQLYEAGVLPACASADVFFEEDGKIDELASTLHVEAQRVDDKVQNYLDNAVIAQEEEDLGGDLEASVLTSAAESTLCDSLAPGLPAPLSKASLKDPEVYNDTLKVVLVGAPHVGKSTIARALRRRSPKKARRRATLGVDVHSWTPKKAAASEDGSLSEKQMRFSVWDVNDNSTAGAHPATQSLFFSDGALFVLVWDMAASNALTDRRIPDDESSEEEGELSDDFLLERFNRQADNALEVDIHDRVLSWVSQIAATTKNCSILPVATLPDGMDELEAQRRCSMMQALLMHHMDTIKGVERPVLVGGTSVIQVNLQEGVEGLKDKIVDVVIRGREQPCFEHMGMPVPHGAVEVLDAVRRLRDDNHKVVLLDHLVAEGLSPTLDEIKESLRFLSAVGDLLYFGADDRNDDLSNYIVLDRKWLVSALSCILSNDLHSELEQTRNFMNMQCEYSGQQFTEGHFTRTLLGGNNSNCPVLSCSDASMLWQSMSFMREAANRSANMSEPTSPACMFEFLSKLLVHAGIFLPLNLPSEPGTESDEVFFVPSLLPQAEPSNVWTYKSSQSWMTTLCHSWLLRDGAVPNMMEHIAVSLLEDLYAFSRSSGGGTHFKRSPSDESDSGEEDVAGRIKIHQVMCWKSSMVVNIGCFFEDPESGAVLESVSDVFISLADQHSYHCVASNSMGGGVKKLIVSGKGQSGHDGRKLWKGGYGLILDSIKASVSYLASGNVQRQVVCPECLSQSHHSDASTWGWDCVRSEVECGNPGIRCMRGHLVDANLLCGTCSARRPAPRTHHTCLPPSVSTPVASLIGGVVVVGLWDAAAKKIRNVGSGFVVDEKTGLIVTAAHILFDMSEEKRFGTAYWGLDDARAVIGVIPDGEETAVFRYFAEIVSHDVQNMDACVLRITTKLENDVCGEGEGCAYQSEIPLLNNASAFKDEGLQQLKLTRKCELEEKVRIIGFNQNGEGVFEQGQHVNRTVDFAKGYVCKKFKALPDEDAAKYGLSSDQNIVGSRSFTPREEVVVICPTISGHSGGPCVNEEGKVIGILSRADPADKSRCYLVPTNELKKLVKLAKAHCSRKCHLYN